MSQEGIDYGRSTRHPYIFFRAPHYANEIDYSTPETEILSSYKISAGAFKSCIWIRVDPDRTLVYSSEIRNISKFRKWGNVNRDLIIGRSNKTLTEYLAIIKENEIIKNEFVQTKRNNPTLRHELAYDVFTSKAHVFLNNVLGRPAELEARCDNAPINTNSEILVSIPHLTPDYFVTLESNDYQVPVLK